MTKEQVALPAWSGGDNVVEGVFQAGFPLKTPIYNGCDLLVHKGMLMYFQVNEVNPDQ